MLDQMGSAQDTAEAVEAIYAAMDEPGDLERALGALCTALGADAARLEPVPDGGVLAETGGFRDNLPKQAVTREGPDGRRYRLSLAGGDGGPDPDRLFGHLLRAVCLSQRSVRAERQLSICSDALERLAVGAVFLDGTGAVTRSAGLAPDVLGAHGGLVLRRDRIAAQDGADDRALQAAIRAALSGSSGDAVTLGISRPGFERDLGVIVQPLPDGAVLLIRDAERGSAPQAAILRQLYGMTPTEAEVASNLSLGLTLDETAAAMSISRNTARAHLRAIFSKSGITRQTELVRLMLGSAAVLAVGRAA